MIDLTCYRGHIRNWATLCGELGVDKTLSPKEREKAIIVAAYKKWGRDIADHLYGMLLLTAGCSTALISGIYLIRRAL